jgi:hypothetical protein
MAATWIVDGHKKLQQNMKGLRTQFMAKLNGVISFCKISQPIHIHPIIAFCCVTIYIHEELWFVATIVPHHL